MRRRLPRTRVRTVVRNIKSKRRPSKNSTMKYVKKAGLGAVAGLAISIPLTLASQKFNQPSLMEAGQRIGSITSAHVGGSIGNAGYQAADALFDRYVNFQGNSISGTREVYL